MVKLVTLNMFMCVCVAHVLPYLQHIIWSLKKKKVSENFKTLRADNYQRGQRTCVCAYVYLCLQDYEWAYVCFSD